MCQLNVMSRLMCHSWLMFDPIEWIFATVQVWIPWLRLGAGDTPFAGKDACTRALTERHRSCDTLLDYNRGYIEEKKGNDRQFLRAGLDIYPVFFSTLHIFFTGKISFHSVFSNFDLPS